MWHRSAASAAEPLAQPLADVRVRLAGLRRGRRRGRCRSPTPARTRRPARATLLRRSARSRPSLICRSRTASVSSRSRSSSVSPTQTIGVRPAAIAAVTVLRLTDRVGLAEQPPPLGVADDHVLGARLLDHRRRHFAGERALALPVEILRRDADVRISRRFGHGVHRGERRRDDDLDVADVLRRRAAAL